VPEPQGKAADFARGGLKNSNTKDAKRTKEKLPGRWNHCQKFGGMED
jgi:hypothetical protein